MVRARRIGCLAALVALATIHGAAQAVYESAPKTLTATIAVIEKDSRIVTLKTTAGSWLHVRAPDEMEGFNTLKVGDVVTATYFEAIAVRLRKPDDPLPPPAPRPSSNGRTTPLARGRCGSSRSGPPSRRSIRRRRR